VSGLQDGFRREGHQSHVAMGNGLPVDPRAAASRTP
jgi:hypothetical protein